MNRIRLPLSAGFACAVIAVASVIAAVPPLAESAPPPSAVSDAADAAGQPAADGTPSVAPSVPTSRATVGSDFVRLSTTEWPAVDIKGYLKVKVTSSSKWRADSDSFWLTIGIKTGVSGKTFTVTAATNKGDQRVGHVTVQSGQAAEVLTVTQSAVPLVTTTPARWDKGPEADTATFTITNTTNRPWAVGVIKRRSHWIRVIDQTADTVTLSVEANTSIKPRTGRVTIVAGSRRYRIVVAQAGAAPAVPAQ